MTLLPASSTAVLTATCPDKPGIVAAVAGFLARHNANIIDASQHSDEAENAFFIRIKFDLSRMSLARAEIAPAFARVAADFGMTWRIHHSDDIPRAAILVSQYDHCLYDLLWRQRNGELAVSFPCVISNHTILRPVAESFGVEFYHLPVTSDTKAEQETALLRLLDDQHIDVVILARYMQILSARVVSAYPSRIINIHHSFLPAFVGAKPYHQAHARGVKIIGATSHYVTTDLDEGPIIAQDVTRVSHRDSVDDLIRKGRDLERTVLAAGVRAHVEDRVMAYGRRTVIFD